MAFRKTFIISDESINTYGFWLLTSGAKLDNFKNNAPCFYDHQTWDLPVGHWENIRIEGTQLKADLVIEGKNEREQDIIRKIENGDIKGASVGFDVLSYSEDPSHMKIGQRRPTVIAWEPYEASVTPLPGNTNAVVQLGNRETGIRLRATEDNEALSKILPNIIHHKQTQKMEKIALALGLPKDSGEDAILQKLNPVLVLSAQADALSKHVEESAKGSLDEKQYAFFVELNKTNATQALEFLKLNSKSDTPEVAAGKQTRVTELIATAQATLHKGKEEQEDADKKETYEYLSKHNPKKLMELKRTDPEAFKKLESAYLLSRKKG